jgi:hypothetical protein
MGERAGPVGQGTVGKYSCPELPSNQQMADCANLRFANR